MSRNGLNKKGKSAHSEELRFTLDSAGRGTAAELLRRLKPYRFKFALSLGLSLVYVFLTLLIPVLAGKIIDCIIGAGRVDFAEISPFLLKLGAAAAGAALSQWLVSLCNNSITYGCVRNIRAEAFRRIQKLPLAYFDSHPAGETVSRMLSDADQLAGGLTVGGLSAFLSYANQYTKPFNEISGVITELQGAFACAARLFELINTPAEVDAAAAPNPAPRNEKAESTGYISFRNVCFSYTPGTELIRDFSLEVKSGMRVAIVGPTGCGKTTLINLLMRFYDVNSGEILIDGVETRSMPRHELRKKFGMVLQETWLQAGTVRQNIAMGRPQAAENEIIAAAKACHAQGVIMRRPEGYDTVLDEAGGSLSQGQKQLLCIARVMLLNPPMLILDEATSSIDTRTELLVQDAFAKLMHGRTSFIVAHRLSTVREADIILVMRSGRIVESGTHDELLRADGFYKKLYESQFAR